LLIVTGSNADKHFPVSVKPLDDASASSKAVAEVVEILNSLSHVPQSVNDVSQAEDDNSVDCTTSEQALQEVYQYLSNSPSKQVLLYSFLFFFFFFP
jgi:hypothetical protein